MTPTYNQHDHHSRMQLVAVSSPMHDPHSYCHPCEQKPCRRFLEPAVRLLCTTRGSTAVSSARPPPCRRPLTTSGRPPDRPSAPLPARRPSAGPVRSGCSWCPPQHRPAPLTHYAGPARRRARVVNGVPMINLSGRHRPTPGKAVTGWLRAAPRPAGRTGSSGSGGPRWGEKVGGDAEGLEG